MPKEFLELAADVFGVDAATLTPETAYESIPEWDSVAHLRLVMETEARFGRPIALEAVASLRTLADFRPYVES